MKSIFLLAIAHAAVLVSSYDINFAQSYDNDAIENERQFLTLDPDLEFIQKLKNTNGSISKPIILTCKVYSTPTVSFTWEKDGEKIQGGIEVNVLEKGFNSGKYTTQSEVTTSVYTIMCPNSAKSGEYSCMANNGHKMIRSEAIVQIDGEREDCPNFSNTKPSIIQFTDTRSEMESNTATLLCRTNMRARYTWIFKNRELNSEEYIILPNGDLFIENLSSEDMGTYTCVAKNAYGESRQDAFLNVTKSVN
ncbi:hypothetical protein CAEBREN_19410 [Caenorhabditis brenneri]|uniref:Ig-like domain-containing protein n=1 Tax=Caenorhabditis brenneri TaxID=135651 RepID=G0MYL1_CAEBE|nr:hypothetical protein CAEBREN_19410 [Caenorhabditis brenneri]